MWALWMIIAVAVGGAVSLTTMAVVTAVYFERRRHRRLMERHRLDRNPSQMHRHHLSITDVDASSLPRPTKSFHHGFQRPRSESLRFYASVSSQDEVRTFPEGTITESVVDGVYCQMEGSHQWLALSKSGRFKRKKKIAKVSTSMPVAKSPMSAIQETMESRAGTPEPVELPAHRTPRMTPEKPVPISLKVVQDHAPIDSIVAGPTPVAISQISHVMVVKSRSISTGSIDSPPNIPLPPIPDTAPYGSQRWASLSRPKSDISLHKRSISAVSHSSNPSKNGLSGFAFELSGEDLIKKNKEKPASKYAQPSFRFPQPEVEGNSEESFQTIDATTWNLPKSLRTSRPITPTPSAPNSEPGSRSVSVIDYDAIFSAGSSLNNSPTKPYEGPLSRPVSDLSVSSTDMFRLSVIGNKVPESPRGVGHKRQNCIRIKNLTPIDSKKRLSSQLGRLTETEEVDESILLPSPSRAGQSQSPSTSDSSLIVAAETANSKGGDALIVPVVKPTQALSLRVRRPGWTSIKDKNKQPRPLPVPGDTIKEGQISQPEASPSSITTGQSPTQIPPTILEATQTSGAQFPTSTTSPASLTRTFSPDSPNRRRAQIQGPRNAPPPSLRVRNQTRAGSPLRRISSENERVSKQHLYQRDRGGDRRPSDVDLPKSSTMLKGMGLPETTASTQPTIQLSEHLQATLPMARTPSSQYADSPTIKVPKNRFRSNTVAGHPGEQTPRATNSPPQQRKDLLAVQSTTSTDTPTHMHATPGKFSYSPSSISIWEDESIRGDSPEPHPRPQPQIPLSISTHPHTLQQHQKPQQLSKWETAQSATPCENKPPQSQSCRYSPVKSRRDHFNRLSSGSYARSISTQLQQQLAHTQASRQHSQSQSPSQQTHGSPIQREPLWKLQQNADAITGRALAMGANTGRSRIRSPRGENSVSNSNGTVTSPRHDPSQSPSPGIKQLDLSNIPNLSISVPVPAGLTISTQMQSSTSSRDPKNMGIRLRSHTVSSSPGLISGSRLMEQGQGIGQTTGRSQISSPSEGIGLGLKFGERSMAYTVNEVETGRVR